MNVTRIIHVTEGANKAGCLQKVKGDRTLQSDRQQFKFLKKILAQGDSNER